MTEVRVAVSATSFAKSEILRNELESVFPEVYYSHKDCNEEELIHFLQKADALIIGKEPLTEKVLKACPSLKVVSKYGVGLDNIDQDACHRCKIKFIYKKGVNALSVAEQSLGFMLNLSHRLSQQSQLMKAGIWQKAGGWQLSQKTISIIGVGHVGKALIQLLKPFDCKILVNDIIDQQAYYSSVNVKEVSKETIYAHSDIVSLHTPLTKETQGLMNKKVFKKMKQSAYIINTARGKIINEKDLYEALMSKDIAGIAMDVYEKEPCLKEKFLALPQVFCTPHIAGNSQEAILNMGRAAIDGLKSTFNSVQDPVN